MGNRGEKLTVVVEVEEVSKKYQQQMVLQSVSFQALAGQIIGITGANGAGKSTLLSLVAGYLSADQGSVRVSSERVIYVPQVLAFFEELTVRANLDLFASGWLAEYQRRQVLVKETIERFSLEEWADQVASQLSTGNRRKLNMAISFLQDADLYLLDEPVTNIDYLARKSIEKVLLDLAKRGKTVILASHHRSLIEAVCHRILVLENGQKKYWGEVNEQILSQL